MKAIVQTGYGVPFASVVACALDFPKPVPNPKANEVRIRVLRAALNPADVRLADGSIKKILKLPLPVVIGRDFAGIVESVPEGSKNEQGLRVGDRVAGYNDAGTSVCPGSFGEYVCCSTASLVRVPANVSLDDAAGLPLAATTAYQTLAVGLGLKAGCPPGQRVLVLGGSSAIGLCATQLFKSYGFAEIVCTSSNAALCRSFGATEVVNYKTSDWTKDLAGRNFDHVFDTVEGWTGWAGAKKVLKRSGGRYASVVMDHHKAPISVGAIVCQLLGIVNRKFWSLFGYPGYHLTLKVTNDGQGLAALLDLCSSGACPSIVDPSSPYSFTAADAARMLEKQAAGACKGKLIMHVAQLE